MDARVGLVNEHRLRANAPAYVHEHRAMREIIPRKPYSQSQHLSLSLVLARAHHSMPEPPEPALVPWELEPGEKPELHVERHVEWCDIASACASRASRLRLAKFGAGVEVRVCATACRTLLG